MAERSRRRRAAVPPDKRVALWANDVEVNATRHEFLFEFVQTEDEAGIVVVRVALSPFAVNELMDDLARMWNAYARSFMPPEIYGDDEKET